MIPAPYTRADTAAAASWLPHIDAAIRASRGDAAAAISEAIEKLYRRGIITGSVATLLSEIFDVESFAARVPELA